MNENTRFSDLSETLAELGGQGVVKVLQDLPSFKLRGISQDTSKVTSARMIKPEFGLLKFSELPALEVQARFNALHGSNTRPRCIPNSGLKEKYIGQPAYFDRLDRVRFESDLEHDILIKELEGVNVPPGALHWNLKKAKDRVFVKCNGCSGRYEWVQFGEITLTGVGKVKAIDLIQKFMDNRPYNASKTPEFRFSFE